MEAALHVPSSAVYGRLAAATRHAPCGRSRLSETTGRESAAHGHTRIGAGRGRRHYPKPSIDRRP
ncbi:hypothetical protein CALVIDRAFT_40262 [Calocera viscosa TUFC12733]|uniref:Uncharacterized protein n=1 Tax=Calocera viscosa (strain TUFC12733) TaxID=1330018 RepID=A0A167P1Q5_CALVF|nr:hypothetical protein CALVIDRAFT_40262 [Calocera viscosa TUFC12733]